MSTLWIFNHHAALPSEATAGARHFHLAKELHRSGWETVVFAGSSRHYLGDSRSRTRRLREVEEVDGVRFVWVRVNSYRGNGLGRIRAMLTFAILCMVPFTSRNLPKPDVVIGSSVHPLAAAAAAVVARRYQVPFYFEIRDLWPETLIQMGAISRSGRPALLLAKLELWLCARAEAVITTMPFAHEYLTDRGVPRSKIQWISNGVDLHANPPASAGTGRDTFEVLYFGAIGQANALDRLIEGFEEFARTVDGPTRLRIVGAGPLREGLVASVEERGLRNVEIVGPVAKAEIPALIDSADVLAVALLPLSLYDYGISLNKLFEYMASGRPVLFAGKARGNPIETSGGGVVTSLGKEDVAAGLVKLYDMTPAERAELGSLNRSLVEGEFAYSALAERLDALLRDPTP